MNEADTCRKFVVPKLQAAGWDNRPHAINEQKSFTDGRVVFIGGKARRGKQKRSDYLLRYNPDFPIAVVEAKSRYKHAAEGLQQAKEYAEILGLRFAYSTNGIEIVEFDYTTGVERTIGDFPPPDDLWARLRRAEGIVDDQVAERLLTPTFPDRTKPLRYYQEIAVNRAVQAALQGRKRALLTLCTGAGKTAVAFQICWKLWSARWNSKGVNRNPKILFLADRNVLVDDPMAKDFSPFGDARHKIAGGVAVKSRDIYFAIYQSIARDENRPGLYREYARDFFDLIIIDECHRGSARDDSNWREILEWFEPATQICAFRRIRSVIPTTSGQSFRSIRSPEDRCRIGMVFDVRLFGPRQLFRRGFETFASNDRPVRCDERCGSTCRGSHLRRWVRQSRRAMP